MRTGLRDSGSGFRFRVSGSGGSNVSGLLFRLGSSITGKKLLQSVVISTGSILLRTALVPTYS